MNKKITLTFLILIFSLAIASSQIYAEAVDINLILPGNETVSQNQTLNENEDLMFYVCPNADVTNIKSSLTCKDDFKFIELDTVNWQNNCYLSKYDLQDISCQNLQIQFEYEEQNQQIQLSKDITIGKNSNILGYVINAQNVDGSFEEDPLYTAYGIWVMSYYGNMYFNEINVALSWLKFNRDDQNKCWPKNNCDITTTSKILYLLKESGFDDSQRIINDAKIWLEKNQNYLSNATWTLQVDANSIYVQDDTYCNLTIDGIRTASNIFIPINTVYETNISVNNNKDLDLKCTQPAQKILQDQFGQVVYSSTDQNLNYHIGDACYGQTQFQVCKEYSNDNFVKYAINIDAGEQFLQTDLNLTLTNDTTISCYVTYGGQMAAFSIPQNQSYTYNLLINQQDDINVACNHYTKTTIYDENYVPLASNITENLTYSVINNCDTTDKYTTCDVQATSAAISSGIDSNLAALAYSWMLKNLKEDVVGSYVVSKDILSNEFFLIASNQTSISQKKDTQKIINWLTFNQNNDGSWGHSTKIEDNIIETIYGALALSNYNTSSSQQSINDAKNWAQDYEPDEGWGNVEKNSLAFWAIKDRIKPFLKTDPEVIIIDQSEVPINVVNPTDFNIKDITFEFTNGMDQYVSVEPIGEIDKKSFERIVLKLKSSKEETHYGFMIIKNNDYQLAKIPLISQKLPEISFAPLSDVTIYGDDIKIKGIVKDKTNGTFICTLNWDDTLVDKTFNINNPGPFDLEIETKELKRQSRNVTGEIICQKNQNTVTSPTSIFIDQYTSQPFNVNPKSLIIIGTKEDVTYTIDNLIDKPITVNSDFDQDSGLLEFDNRIVTINPGESTNITVINLIPDDMNFTQDLNIVVSSLGQEQKIPLRIAIIAVPTSKNSFTNLYIILILFFVFTITWGVLKINKIGHDKKQHEKIRNFINKMRKNQIYIMLIAPFVEKWLEKEFPIQVIENKTPQVGEKITIDTDMIVAVKFLKTIGKDEKTIREKLKGQGFSDAYINECIKQVS